MNENLLSALYLSLMFLSLFTTAELLYHFVKVKVEYTRKMVHVLTGIFTMIFPIWIDNHWWILLLCGSFLIILSASLFWDFLPSINQVDRVTRGSLLYPIIVYGCYLIYQYQGALVYYYLPIMILALCDPVAALVGKAIKGYKFSIYGHEKSLAGCFGFFILAVITSISLLYFLEDWSIIAVIQLSILIAFLASIAEAITQKGYDNFSIPLSVIFVLMVWGI